ncbi:MAG: tetratricopeptide repeat protein [Acidobacteriaceae bacterium]|nr:tetratricopeptide repeat protein [Acidobacteriaceae bacterium]
MPWLFRLHPIYGCLALVCTAVVANSQQKPNLPSDGLRASVASLPPPPDTRAHQITSELRGDIYMARKMYREAIDMYRQGPTDSAVLANKIGIAFHQMLQFDLAKKNYQRALKLDPKYAEAINNLGTVYYSEKNYRKAIGYYKRSLRYSPETASVYANLGAAYFARKDYKRASEAYEQALKLDPDVFEHHSGFGTLMQERTVTELATFHLYLAKTYAKSGANERALIYLRKALEEGVKDREKIPDLPEFASLKKDPAFQQLIQENPKPL